MNRITALPRCINLIISICAPVLLSGCAQLTSIYRTETLPKDRGHLVSIDAKQRVVLSNPEGSTTAATKAILRICAEPPPDVFTALASSLGAEASLRQSVSPDVAAKLAVTLSENAATIERTQTVNILRESMYRNCERYLSGAITGEEFIVQAARDQQLIVQVLAVEQITGVARAQSTALTTIAKATAGGVGEAGLQALSEAQKDVAAKRSASAKATADAAALPPQGPCGAAPIDTNALPSGLSAEQAKTKNAKCTEAAESRRMTKEAEDYLALVKEAVSKQGTASSETQGKLATAAQEASAASVEIAELVVEIVKQYLAFDEIGMTCVVKLRLQQEPPKYCAALLEQMANTRAAQLNLEEKRINAESVAVLRTKMGTDSRSAAESVWKRLGINFTAEKLKTLAARAGVTLAGFHMRQLEQASSDSESFVRAFEKLPKDQQLALATAAGGP